MCNNPQLGATTVDTHVILEETPGKIQKVDFETVQQAVGIHAGGHENQRTSTGNPLEIHWKSI